MKWSLTQLKESLGLHRKRYSWARGDLAKTRKAARAGGGGRIPGVVTKEEAAAIHEQEARVAEELALINRRKQQIAQASGTGRPVEAFVVNVPNQSSRGATRPRIIVLHSTESSNQPGISDLRAVASWFSNPAAQASSHVIVDAAGNSCQCVPDTRKAWTQASYNPQALSVEQVGRAAQNTWPDAQLRQTARYIAYWSHKYGIPIRRSTVNGVCQHSDLGAAGGGHHDCGTGYPLERVMSMARDML